MSVFDWALPLAVRDHEPTLEEVGRHLLRISEQAGCRRTQGLALAAFDLLAAVARQQAVDATAAPTSGPVRRR
jgi:hypothetical protein